MNGRFEREYDRSNRKKEKNNDKRTRIKEQHICVQIKKATGRASRDALKGKPRGEERHGAREA